MEISLYTLMVIGRAAQEYLTHFPQVITSPPIVEPPVVEPPKQSKEELIHDPRLLELLEEDDVYQFPFDEEEYHVNPRRKGVLRITSPCHDSREAYQHTFFHLLGALSITYIYTNIYSKSKLNQFFDLFPHLFKRFPQPKATGKEAIYIATQKPQIPFIVRDYIVHRHSLISSFVVFGFTLCMSIFLQKSYFYFNSDNLPYSNIPFILLINSFPHSTGENQSIILEQSKEGFRPRPSSSSPPPPPLDDSSIQTSSFDPDPNVFPLQVKNPIAEEWHRGMKKRIIFTRKDWAELFMQQETKMERLFAHSGLALSTAMAIYLLAYPMPFLVPYFLTYTLAAIMYKRENVILTDILYRDLEDPLGVAYAYHIDSQILSVPELQELWLREDAEQHDEVDDEADDDDDVDHLEDDEKREYYHEKYRDRSGYQ